MILTWLSTWLSRKIKISVTDLQEIITQMDKDKDGFISISVLVIEVKRWWKQNKESRKD